jgi:hypothetical protein
MFYGGQDLKELQVMSMYHLGHQVDGDQFKLTSCWHPSPTRKSSGNRIQIFFLTSRKMELELDNVIMPNHFLIWDRENDN